MIQPSRAALATAGALAVDQTAAEVIEALREGGVRSILLKGPVIVRWLYGDGSFRPYGDVDLLISPADLLEAARILKGLGFRDTTRGFGAVEVHHASPWMRESPLAWVDLHTRLSGVRVEPAEAWEVLTERTEGIKVGGVPVEVPTEAARAVIVVLHAAHHGLRESKPLQDLGRSLEQVPPRGWADAAGLAGRLDAQASFVAGLRLLPQGAAMAKRLGLKESLVDFEATLRASDLAYTTVPRILSFATARGMRERAALLARALVPTPAFMRRTSPVAGHGRMGLIASYAGRPFLIVRRAGPAFLAWHRARTSTK